MDNTSKIQELITTIKSAVTERSVTNTLEARVLQGLLDNSLLDVQNLQAEVADRASGDAAAKVYADSLADSVLSLLKGQDASANVYPFLDLGNVLSQSAVNGVLDEIFQSTSLKYNGRLRLTRNGALIAISQHVVNASEGYWAQCVAGMLAPSADGTQVVQADSYAILSRSRSWDGTLTPWHSVTGDMQLKTINGQSLVGNGNIVVGSSGNIQVDQSLDRSSSNAVANKAVADVIQQIFEIGQQCIDDISDAKSDIADLNASVGSLEVKVRDLQAGTTDDDVLPFAGSVASATFQTISGPSDGDILWVTGSSCFALRVTTGLTAKYYNVWTGSDKYMDGVTPYNDKIYLDTTSHVAYVWDGSALTPIQGAAVIDQSLTEAIKSITEDINIVMDEVSGFDERIGSVEEKVRTSVVPFDSFVSGVSIEATSTVNMTGTVVYDTASSLFLYRLGNAARYYRFWRGSADYYDETEATIRTDALFINTSTYEVYYWSGGELVKVGGGSSTVDTALSTSSNNAISNAAVTNAINTLQSYDTALNASSKKALTNAAITAAINGLQSQINNMSNGTGSGDGISAAPDDITISTKNALGVEDNTLRLASVAKGDDNSVGTVQVTSNELSTVAESTRYNIYKDIESGNTTPSEDGAVTNSVLTLPAGSKLVPAGGFPQIKVVGGEDSWVHSSDIGMIQVDESWYNDSSKKSALYAQGKHNKAILDNLVRTKFNLILDGTYYIDIEYDSTKLYANAVQLDRPLKIKGGGLDSRHFLFRCNAGSALQCDGVTFRKIKLDNASGYQLFYVRPQNTLLGAFIFRNCNFIAKGTTESGFFRVSATDVRPSDKAADALWTVVHMESFGYTNLVVSSDGTKIYALPSTYTITHEIGDDGEETGVVAVTKGSTAIDEDDFFDVAIEAHALGDKMFVQDDDGEYVFVVITDTEDDNITDRHNSKYGYYCLASELPSGSKTDGNTYGYTTMNDPTTEALGLERFEMVNCYCEGATFLLLNIMFRDRFLVDSCTFTNVRTTPFNIGSNNDYTWANEWLARSCDVEFKDSTFSGPGGAIVKSQANYTCAILCEAAVVRITGCKFLNLFSNRYATYESYLSCREVYFTNNTVHNVFSLPYLSGTAIKMPLFQWGKAKGGRPRNGKTLVRHYIGNTFSVDYDESWYMLSDYFEANFPATDDNPEYPEQVFAEYAMRQKLFEYTSKNVIGELRFENNTIDHPQGLLYPNQMSSRTNYIKKAVVRNNSFNMRSYCASATVSGGKYDYPSRPLLGFRNKSGMGSMTLQVIDNVFVAANAEYLQLATFQKSLSIDSIVVTGNTFKNCSPNMTNMSGQSYNKPLYANVVQVENNHVDCPDIAESYVNHAGYIFDSTTSSESHLTLMGHLLRVAGTDDSRIELYDSQRDTATQVRTLILQAPQNNGYLRVSTPSMRRYVYKALSKYAVGTAKGYTNFVDSSSLVVKFGYDMPKGAWSIRIDYTYHGERKHRIMEFLHDGLSASYNSAVIRDIDGIVHYSYASGTRYCTLPAIDDIRLGMFAELYNLQKAQGTVNLHFYTDRKQAVITAVPGNGPNNYSVRVQKNSGVVAGDELSVSNGTTYTVSAVTTTNESYDTITFGTTNVKGVFNEGDVLYDNYVTHNDDGTDIVITVQRTQESGVFSPNTTRRFTTLTKIKNFVPYDSIVTEDWLDAMADGISFLNTSNKPVTTPYLTGDDAGYRVICNGTYYIWNGTGWTVGLGSDVEARSVATAAQTAAQSASAAATSALDIANTANEAATTAKSTADAAQLSADTALGYRRGVVFHNYNEVLVPTDSGSTTLSAGQMHYFPNVLLGNRFKLLVDGKYYGQYPNYPNASDYTEQLGVIYWCDNVPYTVQGDGRLGVGTIWRGTAEQYDGLTADEKKLVIAFVTEDDEE